MIVNELLQKMHEFLMNNQWEDIISSENIKISRCIDYDHVTAESHLKFVKNFIYNTVELIFMINGEKAVTIYAASPVSIKIHDYNLLAELLMIM